MSVIVLKQLQKQGEKETKRGLLLNEAWIRCQLWFSQASLIAFINAQSAVVSGI